MFSIWLPGRGVAHLAYWRGPTPEWGVLCSAIEDVRPEPGEYPWWREHRWRHDQRERRLVRLTNLLDAEGRRVCRRCLASYVRTDSELWRYLDSIGQAGV